MKHKQTDTNSYTKMAGLFDVFKALKDGRTAEAARMLSYGFTWSDTEEGDDFWRNVKNLLDD